MTPRRSVLETISSSGAKVRASPVGATGRPALREAGRSWMSSKGVLRGPAGRCRPLFHRQGGGPIAWGGTDHADGAAPPAGEEPAGGAGGQTRTPRQDVEQSVDHTVRRPEKTALRTRRSPPGPGRTSPDPRAPGGPPLPPPAPREGPPVPPPPGLPPVPP